MNIKDIALKAFETNEHYLIASSGGIDGNREIVDYTEETTSVDNGVRATIKYKYCDINIYDVTYHSTNEIYEETYYIKDNGNLYIERTDKPMDFYTIPPFYIEEDKDIKDYIKADICELEKMLKQYANKKKLEKESNKKKKFRVWAETTSYCYIEVEAHSEDEAREIAKDVDGGEFITSDGGDWKLTTVEEVNNDLPFNQ